MAIPIEMPKLGNTVEECLLSRWYKHSGDAVVEGDILAEIETDKATFELASPVGGTLLEIFFNDGDLVPVFANVCVVGKEGESTEEFRPRIDAAVAENPNPDAVGPVGQKRHESIASRTAALPVAGDPAQAPLSPRARRFAEEHNFHPAGFKGTGPGGRILEEDLKRLYYESPRSSSLAGKMIADGYEIRGAAGRSPRAVLSNDLTAPPMKMSAVRDRIARRMWNSLATTAQYTINASADATGLLSLRNRIKAREQQGGFPSININEIVVFCTVKALTAVPEINAEFVDGKIYRHSNVHIGFACDTPKGLLVPVIRNSQTLTLPELSSKIKSLTKQAVDGIISPDDLSGGTFTVSNLGSYGIESFSPILNPPQVAILGVNTIDLKPVRRKGKVEFIEHIGLSLTCDHQVIDGAQGARFLKAVKEQIENIENTVGLDI
jgi:pyruvate dehydrogenase E2 component (dihydrolipoamide acetyltransferase)